MTSAVLIAGMHRSGTSAFARVVNLLGVPLGRADDVVGANPGNPTGHWESARLKAVNRRLLETLGGGWDSPPELPSGWERDERLAPLRAEACKTAAATFESERWAWKDPRNCLTLPFWVDALELDPAVVLVHREPLEVARSLETRDGIPAQSGLALWERYNRSLLEAAAGRPALVVSYAELLDDPGRVGSEIGEFLDGLGFEVDGRTHEIAGFVDPSLRRAAPAPGAAGVADSAGQRALRAGLEQLRGAHERLVAPALPPETPSTGTLLAERRAAFVLRRRLARLERDREAAARRLEALESSRVWRATGPLRSVAARVPWLSSRGGP